MQIPDCIQTWQMSAPGALCRTNLAMPVLQPGEALVEIHGCGVCHTDLSYFYGDVKTLQKPPLTLGHEIAGVVVAVAEADSALLGREVIVPAVLPCHDCDICRMGRPNRCLAQKMPGNSLGIYGGFASHIPLPARDLCVVSARGDIPLAHLAVVADAVSTPYQAAQRAALSAGDCVIVIGAGGGVGGFMVQMAKALGARAIVGIDIAAGRLARMQGYGVDCAIDPSGKSVAEVKEIFKAFCHTQQLPGNFGWKIFEVSGSPAGQKLALALLSFVGKLVVVGYGAAEIPFNISRLMAFDAEVVGSWGCAPEAYPTVLDMCLDGRIALEPFVELQPMSRIAEVFQAAKNGLLARRVVLVPDF
jgi:6-hydroxycyclohex-1-ene-1-carbonyl-CoA dehydrogenase